MSVFDAFFLFSDFDGCWCFILSSALFLGLSSHLTDQHYGVSKEKKTPERKLGARRNVGAAKRERYARYAR